MFYTKYRPQTFSEISRPNEAADALAKQITSDKTVHAYLFVGPRGTGKTSTARILAKALNCTKPDKNGDPCDQCNTCIAIKKGSFMDLIEIDAASNRGIDDIRELKNRVKLAPTTGKTKVYIIDEVHMLTSEAFNALLKTLEEPPKNTVFILCTTELHKVPETIKSRCQVFKFKRATIKQLTTKLEAIAKEEGFAIEKTDLETIARASMGGFRDAETMLEQIAAGEVTVDSLLNVASRDKYVAFAEILKDKNAAEAIKMINKVYDEGADVFVWTGEFVKHLRDILLIKSGVSADVFEIPDELLTDVKKQANSIDERWLVTTLELFIEAQSKIKNSFIPQLPIELVIVKVCHSGWSEQNIPTVIPRSPDTNQTKPKISPKTTPVIPVASTSEEVTVLVAEDPVPNLHVESTLHETEEETYDLVSVEIGHIETGWQQVMQKVETLNRSIVTLLKVGKPVAIDGRFLILEVNYLFHKERLEAAHNRVVVEQVLKEIFSADLKIKCVVSADRPKPLRPAESGILTDFNVVVPSKEAVLDMLDGGLPL
jgi:DNA polymerase III subunit gamma/tau